MAFKKGQKKPETSGRKPGTPNKSSLRMLDELEASGFNLVKEYIAAAQKIEDPAARCDKILGLFRYCFPVLKELDPLELTRVTAAPPPPAAAAPPAASPPLPLPGAPPALSGPQLLALFLGQAAKDDRQAAQPTVNVRSDPAG